MVGLHWHQHLESVQHNSLTRKRTRMIHFLPVLDPVAVVATVVVVTLLQGIPVVVVIVVVVVSVVVLPLSFQMMVDQNGLPSIATEEVFVTILRVVLPDLAHVENPYLYRHCHFVISLLHC